MSTLTGATALPDGTLVRGRGRSQPVPEGPEPQFGLYLGSPERRRFSRRPVWLPTWPAEWLDWPDFRTPRDDVHAAARIVATYERARNGERVEIACLGGTGRTGTVVACMAILAGHPADDALAWVRAHYRPHAVETPGQKRWILKFPTLIA
ncbi:MAG: phosphatase [Pseudonocardia sp. SCN 72-86]|nr:MAG: phosphatase [Pseudonocardia sp. SCN 72-86]